MTAIGRPHERGFAFVEVLIVAAIALAIGLAALPVARALTDALANAAQARTQRALVDERALALEADAATSLAVFVPARDVFGAPNAALGGVGHEIDFFARHGTADPIFWAYRFDAPTRTLRRYDYDLRHELGVRDARSGTIDPSASYPALPGVTHFEVQTLMASQLALPANAYAAAFSPLAPGTLQDLPVSLDDAALGRSDLFAGNAVVRVRVRDAGAAREIHLTAGAYPSGFHYTGGPAYHAILWRTDTTVKRLFATRSYVYIWADVDVTYDDWKHYQVWCHRIPIFGEPGGLRKGDPHEDYHAGNPTESAHHILGLCIAGTGTPGTPEYRAARPAPPTPDPLASAYPGAMLGRY